MSNLFIDNVTEAQLTAALAWAADLRSGSYTQGAGALRRIDGWCCLGLICERSKIGHWEDGGHGTHDSYIYFTIEEGSVETMTESVQYPPHTVMETVGLRTHAGSFRLDEDHPHRDDLYAFSMVMDTGKCTLAELNDAMNYDTVTDEVQSHRFPFDAIAEAIEYEVSLVRAQRAE